MLQQPHMRNKSNIILDLQDYMFTSENMNRYSKHMIQIYDVENNKIQKPKASTKNIDKYADKNFDKIIDKKCLETTPKIRKSENKKETMYRPKQKDSLFWCFYILKNGFSNYEMEINNQYFVVEKNEKFKYIELLRKHKDLLKLHKIKPLTELEDDLANKPRISIKTFFALCALENINILLVNKRKVYELLCNDVDETHPINIVHRNNETYEHSIELDPTQEIIEKYRDTYYKMSSFDATLKSMGSYKLEELMELCKKLDINIEEKINQDNKINKSNSNKEGKQKITKKDIYELLVLNY